MRRRALLVLSVMTATFLLAACESGPLAPYVWLGQGQSDIGGEPYSVRLVFTLYGSKFYGSYYLYGATDPTGSVDGNVDERDLTAVLTTTLPPDSTAQPCVFDLTGSIDEAKLTGALVPRDPSCSLARGIWDLERQP